MSLDVILQLTLVFALSFLIGLEREEHKGQGTTANYAFGGIRTFPLIGLSGYAVALLTEANPVALGIGMAVIGAFMVASYLHKMQVASSAGFTSEISGVLTYLLGALVYRNQFWVATALVVLGLLLLELKTWLEALAHRIPSDQLLTLAKFLLLSAVILPVLPNAPYTSFQINPFHTWLVVVAISAVSYGSYILQVLLGSRSGVLGSAILGGAYSSTVTTIALARSSKEAKSGNARLFAGAILSASGVMYLRLAVLLSVFSTALRQRISPALLVLGVLALAAGILESRQGAKTPASVDPTASPRNPLELRAAFLFALLFVAMKTLTTWIVAHMGTGGLYSLSVITGVTDVDPFIMGMTQSAGTSIPLDSAAAAILIAASSNNLVKGAYAYFFSGSEVGRRGLIYLVLLAAAGLLPIILL